jgi:ribosomal protein S12 methylthiotransferase
LLVFVEKGYFQHIGVFEYSHEDNIRSATLGDRIPSKIKEERKCILMEAQQKISFQKNKANIGQIHKVLIEGKYEETELLLKGRNCRQGPDVDGLVLINSGYAEAGQFSEVRITGAHPYDLIGEIV